MGQEYFINSQELQNKVNSLLPSQGGAGAGLDLSASTQIIPIIDLTESAEGSDVRQDLQTSFSFNSITAHSVLGTTTTIINNTGYYRVFGSLSIINGSALQSGSVILNDGATDKVLFSATSRVLTPSTNFQNFPYDFVVFLEAGHSCKMTASSTAVHFVGSTRQIATITGDLVNP